MTKSKKIILIIVLIAVAFFLTRPLWLPRIYVGYVLWELRKDASVLDVVPVQKDLNIKIISEGKNMSFGSLKFTVPFEHAEIISQATSSHVAISIDPKHASSKIAFLGPNINIWTEMKSKNQELDSFFNSSIVNNFDLFSKMVETQYSTISILSNPKNSVPQITLLLLKSVRTMSAPTMYTFENKNGIRGFEFTRDASSTVIELFTPSDQQYTLVMNGVPTTEQVNYILRSIKEN